MVQEAEKLKNNCPLSLVVNSITMVIIASFMISKGLATLLLVAIWESISLVNL